MPVTRVVNLRTEKADVYGARHPEGKAPHLCKVGEPGWLGSPFPAARCGPNALPWFRKYFLNRIAKDAAFRAGVEGLRGKRLGCFCKSPPLAACGIGARHHLAASFNEEGRIEVALRDVRPEDAQDDVVLGIGPVRVDAVDADGVGIPASSDVRGSDHRPPGVRAESLLLLPEAPKKIDRHAFPSPVSLMISERRGARDFAKAAVERVGMNLLPAHPCAVHGEALVATLPVRPSRADEALSAVEAETLPARQKPKLQLVCLAPQRAQGDVEFNGEGFSPPVRIELDELRQLFRVGDPIAVLHVGVSEVFCGALIVLQKHPACHLDTVVEWLEAHPCPAP